MTADAVADFLQTWGYPAYVLMFAGAAVGSPITEDLLLLTGGYLIGADVFEWRVTLPLALVSVLATDAVFYSYGRMLRAHSLRRGSWIHRVVRPGRLRIATRWFNRFRPGVLVFTARLVPGLRILVFAGAGLVGMPLSRFVIADFLACLIFVPALLYVGAVLGEHIGGVEYALRWVGDRLLWLLAAAALVLVLRWLWLRKERRLLSDGDCG